VTDIREEHRLRISENSLLTKIFALKRGEGTRGWRNLHNDRLHNLHISPSIVRMFLSGEWGT
jgi:hypothetical protein